MTARPFVKWVGGKGQLIEQLSPLLPKDLPERKSFVYVEPFVGGGAMLFHMLARYPNISRAIANDLNADLVTAYRVVRDSPERLVSALDALQRSFYALPDEAARRVFYLDRRAQ